MYKGLKLAIRNGVLKITIPIDVLARAADRCEAFLDNDGEGVPVYHVSDQAVFAKSVLHTLQREEEDGSTRITRMFDEVFAETLNQGEDGIGGGDLDDDSQGKEETE